MKPFGLETILKYRQQLEDIAKQKLFKLLEKETDIQLMIQNKQQELQSLFSDLSEIRAQGVTIDMVMLFENRIQYVHEELKELNNALSKQQEETKSQRDQLIKASQDKKILEKLKQQKNTAYKKYLDKKEAAILDEIAVLSHNK
jgi:flagellar FliJ protein